MPNGVIDKENFDKIKNKDIQIAVSILFETGVETQKALKEYIEASNKRFDAGNKRFNKIEKKALISQIKEKGFSGMTGFIGGFMASWIKNHL